MGKKVREYKSGDFIFAKVKGYPAWPARVQRNNGKKYFVYFYGTGETANLPPNMIFDYAENKDKFLSKSVKRKDFNDGVRQIENDFINNVSLEDVIGVAVEEPAEAANNTVDDSTVNETVADESSANDTMAESMADTTVADETVGGDVTPANVTQIEGGIEDSDEAGTLVIDEGKKGRKSKVPEAVKTPAKVKEVKTPRGRSKKEEPKDEQPEKVDGAEEIVSRSGRKIRPKRYIDEQTEENATLPSPAPKKRKATTPPPSEKETEKPDAKEKNKQYNAVSQSELEDLKEPFKPEDEEKDNILIAYLPTGQYVGIKLTELRSGGRNESAKLTRDKNAATQAITLKTQLECAAELHELIPPAPFHHRGTRRSFGFHPYVVSIPSSRTNRFASTFIMRTAEEWNSLPADVFPEKYYLELFKARVDRHFLEKGHITAQSVSTMLVMDLNLTEEEKATLDKEREIEEKKSRVQFLKTEMKLIELDAKIKTCLSLEKADTELCLKLLDELSALEVRPLMLLKHPTCLETVKRMRAYVGNTPSWELSESDALVFGKQAHHIRRHADKLYNYLKNLFTTPEGLSFWEYFSERVLLFKKATAKLNADELLEMVHEPLEMSVPTAHTMKAAIEAANEVESPVAEEVEAVQKKKNIPAKSKKPVNNTPVKPTLKRQSSRKQEEKEKEKEKEASKKAEDITEKPTGDPEDEIPAENSEEPEAPEEKALDSSNAEKETNDDANKESTEKVAEDSDTEMPKDDTKPDDEIQKEAANEVVENNTKASGDSKDDENKDEVKANDKPEVDEPRAKRSRESKKTESVPRSPAKRKAKS